MLVFLSSLGVFFSELVVLNFLLFYHAALVAAAAVVAASIALICAWNHHRSAFHLPLGVCCGAAVVVGAAAGACCYDRYGYLTFVYANSRTYENIVPSERAAAIADAGRILFAAEARLDQSMSAGYAAEDGFQYCVAPVRGLQDSTHIEFWAVGMDCCSPQRGFSCDAAGDPDARGGVVIFMHGGIFRRPSHEYFMLARKKAEGMFGLTSAEAPIYIRWVTKQDVDVLPAHFTKSAWVFIILATCAYAGISAAFVWVVCKSFMQGYNMQ